MGFKIGQKVICVHETASKSVIKNEIYTVAWVGKCRFSGEYGIRLEETEPAGHYINFSAWRFKCLKYGIISNKDIISQIVEEKSDIRRCPTNFNRMNRIIELV